MALLSEIVDSLGGMAQKQQLVRRGAGDRDLTYAVRIGDVVRVRNGWYSTMPERSPELRAVRVGGRLTGISAVAARGGWVLGDHPLHVAVNENAARLRTQHNRHKRLNAGSAGGVRLHWETREQTARGDAVSVGLADALLRVILDEPFETAVAALDWAIHAGQLDIVDFESLILRLPAERRGIRDWVDPKCDSLPESLARTRLRLRGYSVESQFSMPDGRPIDLLVGGIAAVEVDGDEFHRDRFEADRAKDIDITLMGLHALRPSARAVFRDWAHVERAVDAAIRARTSPASVAENSGIRRHPPANSPGLAGWRRRSRRGSPVFSPEGSAGQKRRRGGRAGKASGQGGADAAERMRQSGCGAGWSRIAPAQTGNSARAGRVGGCVSDAIKVDIWSDVQCPWCYIGKRKFEAAVQDFDGTVDVEYHSFELAPDTPVDFAGTPKDYLAERKGISPAEVDQMLERVTGIAASVGLDYDYDHVHQTNTVKAHELLHFAKTVGRQLDMKERLLKAYFIDGRHVGRIDDLADLAAEIDLDRDEVVRVLSEETFLPDVKADMAQAQAYGINGVPFFVFDEKYGVSGAQDASIFANVLQQVASEKLESSQGATE